MSRQPPPNRPLGYAAPEPADAPATNTLFHQAAKASWAAPLILLGLGALTNTVVNRESPDRTIQILLGIVALLLLTAGFTCGIVALFGVRRYGARGILAPAIVGLLFNVAWVALVVSVVLPAISRARAIAAARRVPPPAPISSPQSALRQTGWMGYSIDAKYAIGAAAMDDRHTDTLNLKSNFGRDFTALVLWADNRANDVPINVSTIGATVRMNDGTVVNALNTRDVVETAKVDREQFIEKWGSQFAVPARDAVEGRFMFLPPDIDMSRVQSLYLSVDGVKVMIPGRIFTAEEKTQRMKPKGTQQDPSNL
jgi:hypothetical protein